MLRMIRFLWHDVQLLIRGSASQNLNLHFEQRWSYSLTRNTPKTRTQILTVPQDVRLSLTFS
jgi:phosphatidylserine/phosphatidylglycerophosphate/cardiolipin synthase-like enzyme